MRSQERRTSEVVVEPFGLLGADMARPPPRVRIAGCPLQHTVSLSAQEFLTDLGRQALLLQDRENGDVLIRIHEECVSGWKECHGMPGACICCG